MWFTKEHSGLTHYQTTNFRLFQTERICRRNFKFDKCGIKLSKWVENTVGKGKIAHYEQSLLFSLCFQKACFPGVSKGVIVWEWVKQQHTGTNCLQQWPLELHLISMIVTEDTHGCFPI